MAGVSQASELLPVLEERLMFGSRVQRDSFTEVVVVEDELAKIRLSMVRNVFVRTRLFVGRLFEAF